MHKINIYTLLVLCSLVNINIGFGQFNIKVGYNGGFAQLKAFDQIIDDYNNNILSQISGSRLDKSMNHINSLHGIEIGLRYRINRIGFEISWNSISGNNDVIANYNNSNSIYQDKWFQRISEFSFGIENYFGNFGYGGAIGYRSLTSKTDIKGVNRKKRTITDESGFCGKFYLIYEYPGDKVSIAIKPYVQFPLANFNISSFEQGLYTESGGLLTAPTPKAVIDERFIIIGLSFVLYNGPQN